MHILLPFAIVIAFTAVSIGFSLWRARRRSGAIAPVAQALGLAYQANHPGLPAQGLIELPVFAAAAFARHPDVSNLMKGTIAGRPVIAFDYAYCTGSLQSQRFDYAQTVACFELPADRAPAFILHPAAGAAQEESAKLALGAARLQAALATPVTRQDPAWQAVRGAFAAGEDQSMAFTGYPEFAAHYRLIGSDADGIRRIFTAAATECLLTVAPLSIESSGAWLAIYRKNKQPGPADLAKFLEESVSIRNALFPNA